MSKELNEMRSVVKMLEVSRKLIDEDKLVEDEFEDFLFRIIWSEFVASPQFMHKMQRTAPAPTLHLLYESTIHLEQQGENLRSCFYDASNTLWAEGMTSYRRLVNDFMDCQEQARKQGEAKSLEN